MSEQTSLCVICNQGATSSKRLISNSQMIDELAHCCEERLSLGETDIQQLTKHLSSLDESERKSLFYHNECRKPLVNKCVIERLRAKRSRSDSPGCSSQRGPGRPSSKSDSTRPKRTKTIPKAEICVFSTCGFCPGQDNKSEPLHQVLTNQMGETFLEIKSKTLDDSVRTCMCELDSAGDASALEKYYHRKCLRSAQRTFTP